MPYGILAADQISTSVTGVSLGAGNATRFKNRIINGDMRIDQRNAGASVTPADSAYTLDRYQSWLSQASKVTVQQSTTAPAGFTNSMLITSSSAYTLGTNDEFGVTQKIEGFNIADLGFGTANAKTLTLSFWVRSSLTGTFGGILANNGLARVYAFQYTVNTANTWEQKSITVTGDTSGTWLTNNGWGLSLSFSLGAGSSRLTTSGSWGSNSAIRGATGQVNLVSTSGATLYITGVQLEVGESATGFEYVDYGVQLVMCQRYYQKSYDMGTVPGTAATQGNFYSIVQSGTSTGFYTPFKVNLRTSGTFTVYSTYDGASGYVREGGSSTNRAVVYGNVGDTGAFFYIVAGSAVNFYYGQYTINAEL